VVEKCDVFGSSSRDGSTNKIATARANRWVVTLLNAVLVLYFFGLTDIRNFHVRNCWGYWSRAR